MKATLLIRRRVVFGDRDFAELVVWQAPGGVAPSRHGFKYRLAYVVEGAPVVGFDNERGKGDHQHEDGREEAYRFTTVEALLADFANAVMRWRKSHGRS